MFCKILIFTFCLCEVIVLSFSLTDVEYKRFPDLYSLEDYDSCLQEENGHYCVARFELFSKDDSGNELYERIKNHAKVITKHYNYSKVDKGICVSKTCKKYYMTDSNIEESVDLKHILERCVNESIWNQYKLNAKLSFIFQCDRHGEENPRIDKVDWAVTGLIVTMLLLTIAGSYHDIKVRNMNRKKQITTGNKFLLCFSVLQNWRSLTTQEQGDPRLECLKGLHAVRNIVIIITIFAHMTLLVGAGFTKDPQNLERKYEVAGFYFLHCGLMVVQVFFFLSGFILAFFLKIQAEKRNIGWAEVPKILIIRWCRLTPICAVVIAFFMSWMRHLGSGPLWNMVVTNGATAQCRSYWWAHLLYMNNFLPDNKYCLMPSWHIAADMQMFALGVMAHVATRSRGRLLGFSVLLAAGMLAPAVHSWLYGTDALVILTPELLRQLLGDTFYYVHNRGYMNLPCFVLGMMTGYLAYNLQRRGTDFSQNKVLKFLSWWIIPLFMGVIYSGRMFYEPEARGSLLARMGYAATHRAALGVLCAAWVLGLICKCNEISRVLFEWRGWAFASKLSYCVYLFHMVCFHVMFGARRELMPVSYTVTAFVAVAVTILSYIVAVPMYLMIEAPINRFVKTLVEDRMSERTKVD